MTPLLRVANATITAPGGRILFQQLTIQLARGERVALVGRNGVGKSTLLAHMAESAGSRAWLVPQALRGDKSPGQAPARSARDRLPRRPTCSSSTSPRAIPTRTRLRGSAHGSGAFRAAPSWQLTIWKAAHRLPRVLHRERGGLTRVHGRTRGAGRRADCAAHEGRGSLRGKAP